jgi:mRNA-degrading endonuclease RelE of RelBE toxin-antitoxin system
MDKRFEKLAKKDKAQLKRINSKIEEICKNPYAFKPLKTLQNKRGVYIGPFVAVFKININDQ